MMTALFDQVLAYVRTLSPREQRLGGAVLLLGVLFLIFSIVRGAVGYMNGLDTQIDRLQDQLMTYNRQLTYKQSVEARYAMVAAQHSSAWTAEEIRDRLRSEIYRLAQKVPPPLDENGIPVTVTSDSGLLVEIPELREGRLYESEEGYREYAISFRLPSVEINDLIAFLARLQGSPQSLRIDGLEISRGPFGTKVSAGIDLTRTIVDGSGFDSPSVPIPNDAEIPILASQPIELLPQEWTCEGCTLTVEGDTLVARSEADRADVFLTRELPAAKPYDLFLDVASDAPGMIGIADGADAVPFAGAQRLAEEGLNRYHLQFTTPGGGGNKAVRVPALTMQGKGSTLTLRQVVLRPGDTG
jgi:type II secretory pathway component PulM